jgi:hypothetical protein
LEAARHPEIWAGVSAWASITSLPEWWTESKSLTVKYSYDIERACGNFSNHTIDQAACLLRSSVHYLNSPLNFNNQLMALDVNAGIYDGHFISGDKSVDDKVQKLVEKGVPIEEAVDAVVYSVPIRQSLNLYNQIALTKDVFTQAQIDQLTGTAASIGTIPPAIKFTGDDPLYTNASLQGGNGVGKDHRPVLVRRQSGNLRLTIFQGYHEIVYWAALSWLAQQWRP